MPINDSLLFDAEPIQKRSLVMLILVDTSGSMKGARIGAVNTALEELLPELAEMGEADAEIKLSILTFDDDVTWLMPAPIPPRDFVLEPLVAGGQTFLGAACRELNRRMSRSDLFASPGSSFAPIMILMSDGEPSDLEHYKTAMEELRKNRWFKVAFKYALPIGTVMDTSALAMFTDEAEAVLEPATRASDLIKKIKMVALESVKFSTISQTTLAEGEKAKGRQSMILETIDREIADDDFNVPLGVNVAILDNEW